MTPSRVILCLLALVLPVALWTGSTTYDSAKFLFWGLAGAAWLAVGGAGVLLRRPAPGITVAVVAASLSMAAVIAVGLPAAAAPALAWRTLLWAMLWWLAVGAAATTLRAGRDRLRLLACAVTGAAAVGVVALLQHAGLAPTTASWYAPRGIGTLGNENSVAELAAIWLVPSLLLPLAARRHAARLIALLPAVVFVAVLAASPAAAARVAALAAVGLALAGEFLLRSRLAGRAPLLLGGLVLVLAVAAALAGRAVLDPRYDAASRSAPARLFAANHGAERRTDWLVAARIFHDAPLSGCGAGGYGARWLQARAAIGSDPEHRGLADGAPPVMRAHNEYLQWAAETGWPGIAWLAAMALCGALAWSRWWRAAGACPHPRRERRSILLPTAGLGAAAVVALVAFPAHQPAPGLALALLVGLLLAAAPTGAAARPGPLPRVAALPLVLAAAALTVSSARVFWSDLHLARGQRLFTEGNVADSLAWLQRGVSQSPWPGEGRLYLGLALAAANRGEEAAAQLSASLRDRPSFEAPLALAELAIDSGQAAAATNWLDLVDACLPPAGIARQSRYLRAYALLRAGRLAEAAAAFTQATKTDRLDHRSWLGLGYARVRQGDDDGAREAYGNAVAALEHLLAAPRAPTRTERGEAARLRSQLEVARRALASVGG